MLTHLTRFALAAAAVAGMALVAAAPASADDRIAIGDSVMLGARKALQANGFGVVDAAVSRQSYAGPSLLRKRGAGLPRNVVIHLGTNGTFPLDVCKKMVNIAGPARKVFLVTVDVPRSWEKANNKTIRKCAASYPQGRVQVIDWKWAASRHSGWIYRDGFHLNPTGARQYARIIDEAVDRSG